MQVYIITRTTNGAIDYLACYDDLYLFEKAWERIATEAREENKEVIDDKKEHPEEYDDNDRYNYSEDSDFIEIIDHYEQTFYNWHTVEINSEKEIKE